MVHVALKSFSGQTVWHIAGQKWFWVVWLTIILQYESNIISKNEVLFLIGWTHNTSVLDISAPALFSDPQLKFWCFVLASGPAPGADLFSALAPDYLLCVHVTVLQKKNEHATNNN